jgi:hypothetical protein
MLTPVSEHLKCRRGLNSGGSFPVEELGEEQVPRAAQLPGHWEHPVAAPQQLPRHRDFRQILLGRGDAKPISQVGGSLSRAEVAGRY